MVKRMGKTDMGLKAVANPERLRIIAYLRSEGECTVGAIADALGLAPGSVSYHLKLLEKAGYAKRSVHDGDDRRKSWWHAAGEVINIDASDCFGSRFAVDSVHEAYADAYRRYRGALDVGRASRLEIGVDALVELTESEAHELEGALNQFLSTWSPSERGCESRREAQKMVVTVSGFPWIP